ncbi:ankyrin repeat protein [Fusarium flagelliforme]|uniref:Ankyrin repeat protein n=1 Tax=Fusarium flagelliforme TaxID=2675880 RepID=A0A395MYU3_9HYPO|nr:ankyrin repeat protein [Fusarium flagelliforme]
MSTIIADRVRDRTLTRDDFKDMASGDDINKPVDGNTPLGYAVLNGDTYAIRLLINHKANINKKSPNGLSPLHMAVDAKENAARVVQILLESPDIKIDEEDDSYPHDTPLMRALKNNPDPLIVKALKDKGSSVNTPNSKGETALDLADRLLNAKVKEALVDPDPLNPTGTSLTRFLVSSAFLAIDYLAPKKPLQDSVIDAFRVINKEIVEPRTAPSVSAYPTTKPELKTILDDVVATYGLESFFGPGSPVLDSILLKAHTVVTDPSLSLRFTAAEVRSSFHMALYQPIIYCDDSGSMKEENRWPNQSEIVSQIASTMSLFSADEKGAHIRFINKSSGGDNLKGDALKAQMGFTPDGSTKIGTNLNSKILEPFIYSVTNAGTAFERPILVIIITDGWPTEEAEDTLQNAIITCQQRLQAAFHPRDAVLFSANQIGSAPQAEKFLSGLMEVSKRPEFDGVLRVSAEKLDAKFAELRNNRTTLQFWIDSVLFGP